MLTADLHKSLEQYRRIVAHAQQLDRLLNSADTEQLQNYVAMQQCLQDEAAAHDRTLLGEIASDFGRWQQHPLFIERMQLLEQIVEMNALLLPRVHGIMAVAAAEIAQLKDGRAAVSGYNQRSAPRRQSSRGVG